MNWADVRVLVTGGAGFIGSHLAERLLELGCETCIADDFSRGREENIESFVDDIKLYRVDLTELSNCLLVTRDVDFVFHLAASVGGIHYILRENVAGMTKSIMMNTNMLEAAHINDVERFLFTSSACVYRGEERELNTFREEDAIPANPLTTYGWVKLMGEIQCKAYYLDYGLKSSNVRIFNAYGERENLDLRSAHVIPSLIRKAVLYPEEGFEIFGDGRQERAFLYVKDCVEGLLLAMEKIENADPINLGSEEVVTIEDLAKRAIELSGNDIEIEHDLSGPQGTRRYCADISKMKRVLGWMPEVPLDQGLKRTYSWVKRELHVEK